MGGAYGDSERSGCGWSSLGEEVWRELEEPGRMLGRLVGVAGRRLEGGLGEVPGDGLRDQKH